MSLSSHSDESDSTNYSSDDEPSPLDTSQDFDASLSFDSHNLLSNIARNSRDFTEAPEPESHSQLNQEFEGPEIQGPSFVGSDRKRRLPEPTHGPGRRRTNSGGFHTQDEQLSPSGPSGTPQGPRPSRVHSVTMADLNRYGQGDRGSQGSPESTRRPSGSSNSEYTLPRWQPDSEVSHCPICGSQFTWYFRKHHCRKCGRVVCANCSPHRITIPRQFIVQPPDLNYRSSTIDPLRDGVVDLTSEEVLNDRMEERPGSSHDPNPALGGGEEVRLCNPCVPDPQPEPPPSFSPPTGSRQNSRWSTGRDYYSAWAPPQRQSPYSREDLAATWAIEQSRADMRRQRGRGMVFAPDAQANDMIRTQPPLLDGNRPEHSRFGAADISDVRRTIPPSYQGHTGQAGPPVYSLSASSSSNPQFHGSLPMPGYLPPSMRRPPSHESSRSSRMPEFIGNRPRVHSMLDVPPRPSSSIDPTRPPRPRVSERDICPICRHILPPVGPGGDESVREQHIMQCIASRDPTYILETPPPPTTPSSSSQQPPTTSSPQRHNPSPFLPLLVQMIRFNATEKDCTAEDGSAQECSICMVEYEVGEKLVRLECLCKFHEECIAGWFRRKRECPVHKRDEREAV